MIIDRITITLARPSTQLGDCPQRSVRKRENAPSRERSTVDTILCCNLNIYEFSLSFSNSVRQSKGMLSTAIH
jgi:hypothetical protein